MLTGWLINVHWQMLLMYSESQGSPKAVEALGKKKNPPQNQCLTGPDVSKPALRVMKPWLKGVSSCSGAARMRVSSELWASLFLPESNSMAPGHPGCCLDVTGPVQPVLTKKQALPCQGGDICQDCRIGPQTLEMKHSSVKGKGKTKSPGKS